MNLCRTQDNSKCLKRTDHWVGTLLTFALFAGAYYISKNNVNIVDKLHKLVPPVPVPDIEK